MTVPANATPEEVKEIVGNAAEELVRNIPAPAKTADMSAEELEAVAQTEKYKAFAAKADELANALLSHIREHSDEYDCAVVISTVVYSGRDTHCGGIGAAGRMGSVLEAVGDLFKHPKLGTVMKDLATEAAKKQTESGEGEDA